MKEKISHIISGDYQVNEPELIAREITLAAKHVREKLEKEGIFKYYLKTTVVYNSDKSFTVLIEQE